MPHQSRSKWLSRFVAGSWHKVIVNECPDEHERRRRERIANIKLDVAMREAMRQWGLSSENRKV